MDWGSGDIILGTKGEPLADSRTLNLKVSMMPSTSIPMNVFREGHHGEAARLSENIRRTHFCRHRHEVEPEMEDRNKSTVNVTEFILFQDIGSPSVGPATPPSQCKTISALMTECHRRNHTTGGDNASLSKMTV